MEHLQNILLSGLGILIFFIVMLFYLVVKWFKKVPQGVAMVRTGAGGAKVSFNAIFVIPVLHKMELMDISLKTLKIHRHGKDGLICQDNVRADIEVAFFVRVNKTVENVVKVAQTIGCERASKQDTLVTLFDAKFSEALKTVGRRFDFIELYSEREKFKAEILNIIGTDLNGYHLDDCAIDYLEQTPLEFLKAENILDSQGIKKITEITAEQNILANQIRRNEEKTITKQDVEAKEAILELNRQLIESEEKQAREVSIIRSTERAESDKIGAEQRLRADLAKIKAQEESSVAEENKNRQIIIAAKSKERTEQVETERVEKDASLERTEKEKLVALAQIGKEKAVEEEKKNIQDVIRERVMLEKTVVQEEEKIKDTRAFADANRTKEVQLTLALTQGEQEKIRQQKLAEAQKLAAELKAQQVMIEAEAMEKSSVLEVEARKMRAEAVVIEESTKGMAEARVIEAKAVATEKQGVVEANVMEKKFVAEANGVKFKSEAEEKRGLVEAHVLQKKLEAEAQGILQKADAMKKLDGVGKEHEEFKLRLEKEKTVELANITIQKDIADAQAMVIAEALKSAKIDIVGGETMFFDQIMNAITRGKSMDQMVQNSKVYTDLKESLLPEDGGSAPLLDRIQSFMERYQISSEDIKNMSLSAAIMNFMGQVSDDGTKKSLEAILGEVRKAGLSSKSLKSLGL